MIGYEKLLVFPQQLCSAKKNKLAFLLVKGMFFNDLFAGGYRIRLFFGYQLLCK